MYRISKPNFALKYLEKALDIVETMPAERELIEINANIFINLSSVHSLRSKHDIALNYCSKAITLLTKVYNKIILEREKETVENSADDDTKNQVFFHLCY